MLGKAGDAAGTIELVNTFERTGLEGRTPPDAVFKRPIYIGPAHSFDGHAEFIRYPGEPPVNEAMANTIALIGFED